MRDLRGYLYLLGVMALALALMLFFSARAAGSPAHRDAVLASTDAWLAEQLRVPVDPRVDSPGAVGELKAGMAWVPCSATAEAHYDPPILDAMADRADLFFEQAWAAALHEHDHLLNGHSCLYAPGSSDVLEPTWSFFEEGFTEAVRVDLFPAFMWRMFHLRVPGEPMDLYVRNVATVRALSALATGSRTWRSREARLWRRAGLLADWPARQRMIADANARAAA